MPRPKTRLDPADAPPAAAGFAPLVTERLTLRPLRAADAEALHRLVNDWEVVRMLSHLPFPYPRRLADDLIASTARRPRRRRRLSSGHHRP